jgi:mannose-6-phosphate isomerase-like protein (cupin superfamily)
VAQVSEWHTSAADAALAKLSEGRRSAQILRHGSVEVRWYAPQGSDPQESHDRDEIYIVASGEGMFVRGTERVPFRANDMLFVPARMEHRFEAFSADFATWVVFWGPRGGERENPFPRAP